MKKKIFLFISLIFSAYVLTASSYYSTTPFFITKILMREVVLKAIEAAISIHDPIITKHASTGPPISFDQKTFSDQSSDLTASIQQKFPGKYITINSYDNRPLIRSRYSFEYQPAFDEHLVLIKKKYNLEKIVTTESNDFKKITELSNWLSSQFNHGGSGQAYFDDAKFNVDTILQEGKKGSRFWCHVYAMSLVQLATAIGYQGRLLSLSNDSSLKEHAVAEIWSNYYKKWVVIDPDYNIWYTKNGIPLNALEIHNALIDGLTKDLVVVKGKHRPQELEHKTHGMINYYKYFEVSTMRNDWLTNKYFKGHPKSSDSATLFWKDSRLQPIFHFKTETEIKNDLYWEINRVHMLFDIKSSMANELLINIDTLTPNFDHFEVMVDEITVSRNKSSKIIWSLHEGKNSIQIKPVNSFGTTGIQGSISLFMRDS